MLGGAVMVLMGLFFCCMLWCYRSSLETAIAIIDAAADFFIATKRLILVSVMYFMLSVVLFLLWALAEFSLLGMNEIKPGSGAQGKEIVWNDAGIALLAVNAFLFMWLLALISDICSYTCMVSAATYYFTSNASADGSASVCTALGFANKKNLGSLCYGSFIITVIRVIKFLIDCAAEGANQEGDGAAKCIACIA
jgi:hypothetical protein